MPRRPITCVDELWNHFQVPNNAFVAASSYWMKDISFDSTEKSIIKIMKEFRLTFCSLYPTPICLELVLYRRAINRGGGIWRGWRGGMRTGLCWVTGGRNAVPGGAIHLVSAGRGVTTTIPNYDYAHQFFLTRERFFYLCCPIKWYIGYSTTTTYTYIPSPIPNIPWGVGSSL